MKKTMVLVACITTATFMGLGCSTMNKSQKGAVIGGATGSVAGAVVGHAAGNTALGTIIGAAVGGATGAIIGHHMDKQAEEIKKANADATVVRVGEGIEVEFKDKILFGYDHSDLSPSAMTNLGKVAAVLIKYPDTNIQVQGHTDNSGTSSYNQDLSERRANSVVAYLEQQTISSSRLTAKGFGEGVPKYSNDTEDGQAKNRRVEFLITANDNMKAAAKKEAASNASGY